MNSKKKILACFQKYPVNPVDLAKKIIVFRGRLFLSALNSFITACALKKLFKRNHILAPKLPFLRNDNKITENPVFNQNESEQLPLS